MTQRIKIPRASDRTVEQFFHKLAGELGATTAHVSALGFVSLSQVPLTEAPSGEWAGLLEHNSYLIDQMSTTVAGLNLRYLRGGQSQTGEKSAIFDEIFLDQNNNVPATSSAKLDVVALINSELRPFEPDRFITGSAPEEQSQLLALHNSTLERLERLNEDLIRQSSEFRRNLEQQFDLRAKEGEEALRAKAATLEEAYRARAEDLDAQQSALDEKLKVIDDRDNTHARREIRDRMLEDVRERVSAFGVSEATERKRRPVLYGIYALVVTFACLLGWTTYEIASLDRQYSLAFQAVGKIASWGADAAKAAGVSPEVMAKISTGDVERTHLYWLWLRFTVFSLGLVGTLLYYVKWQNRWAEQHSETEFQLRQFQIDVSRANWVIESCLEWRKETESAIPPELLGSITRNLFVSANAQPEQVMHPADELASALMGTASKVKLKVGDSEIDFDKPAKIAKATRPIPVRSASDE